MDTARYNQISNNIKHREEQWSKNTCVIHDTALLTKNLHLLFNDVFLGNPVDVTFDVTVRRCQDWIQRQDCLDRICRCSVAPAETAVLRTGALPRCPLDKNLQEFLMEGGHGKVPSVKRLRASLMEK